ncbi:MAG: putative pterin-4-alpha-carbinolamine dehydratase [Candidatus Parcubacteria bacterium]|nr:MAG: putative pterin-4-alpha-carbinolamine dehydratase [Candidatus Parcubacteria bacterium]GIW67696.1 MAG: putative pterin-4-alpha-carbinolamine dehydratase [Candidatus Parcubacteria bacterium]
MELHKIHCIPCEGGIPALSDEEEEKYIKEVAGWELIREKGEPHKIRKKFEFKNFKEAMKFVNKVAEIAEEEGHHPDIHIFYNKVEIELWTHAINGLHKNDFILAAKIDKILE